MCTSGIIHSYPSKPSCGRLLKYLFSGESCFNCFLTRPIPLTAASHLLRLWTGAKLAEAAHYRARVWGGLDHVSHKLREVLQLITSCIHWTHSFLSHALVCSHLDFLSLLIPFIPMTWSANNYFLFHCQMLPVTQIPTISCLMTACGPAPPQWLLPIDFKKGFIFLSAIAILPASDFPPSEGYRCPSDFHHPSIPEENIQVYFKTFLLFIPFISFIHCCSLSTLTCLALTTVKCLTKPKRVKCFSSSQPSCWASLN